MHPKLNQSFTITLDTMAQSKQKQKLWSTESMEATVESVKGGKGLREASRLYNVSIESLRRRVTAGSGGDGLSIRFCNSANEERRR